MKKYNDKERRKKWSENMRRTNQSGIITKNREIKVHNKLQEIKYCENKFLNDLKIKSTWEIIRELKEKVPFPKIAIRILSKNISKKQLNQINNLRKRKEISKAISEKMKDPEYRLKCIKNWTSHNGKKYHSKGELRLKNWLKDNFPEYDWKTKHLIWNNEGFEFDIHSKEYDDFYIEYNGIIHYKNLYKSQKFSDIQRKDKLKIQIMKQQNKKFLVVKDASDFKEQIKLVTKFIK